MLIRTSDLWKEFDRKQCEVRVKSFAGDFFVVVTPLAGEAVTIHTTKSQDEARAILSALCDAMEGNARVFDLRVFLAEQNK